MIAYFILYIVVLLCSTISARKNSNKYLIFISILLALFSGLRNDVGVDYISYEKMFTGGIGYSPNEPGLKLILSLLQMINIKPQLLFLLFSIVLQIALYRSLLFFQSNYAISIMIFLCIAPFYLGSFNGIRQSLAIILTYNLIPFLYKKKYIKYFIFTILITSFVHLSALIMLPIVFISQYRIKNIKKILIAIAIFISISSILSILQNTVYGKYLYMDAIQSPSLFSYIFIVISCIMFFIEPLISYFKNKEFFFNMNFFAGIVTILAIIFSYSYIGQMMMRVTNYFFFAYIFLIPLVIENLFRSKIKYIIYGIVVFMVSLYYIITITVNGKEYNLVPYSINFNIV